MASIRKKADISISMIVWRGGLVVLTFILVGVAWLVVVQWVGTAADVTNTATQWEEIHDQMAKAAEQIHQLQLTISKMQRPALLSPPHSDIPQITAPQEPAAPPPSPPPEEETPTRKYLHLGAKDVFGDVELVGRPNGYPIYGFTRWYGLCKQDPKCAAWAGISAPAP